MAENKNYKYDRYLSSLDVWAIAFGGTIGWGAFMMPGSTFLPVAGPLGTLIGMSISVAIMLVIGANFSFLMRHRPGTGGVYTYAKEALGRDHAFFCAWFLALSYLAILFLNATSLFTVIRTVFGSSLQIRYQYYNIGGHVIYMGEVGASIVALACVGLLFINAKPLLQRLQTVLAIILLACILIVAAFCLPHLSSLSGSFGIQENSPIFAVFSIVMIAPLAFVGFEVISLETVHFNFEVRRSRRIIVAAILLSGLVYVAMTLVSISTVPDGYASWQAYIADLSKLEGLQAVPTFSAAHAIMGKWGLVVTAVAALTAILTGMIATYRATTRVLSTMAEYNILSEKFSKTNNSILFIMLISMIISIFGRSFLESFMGLTAFGAVIGFGYTSFSTWKLAREKGSSLFAVTGALGIIASIAFAYVSLIPNLTALDLMSSEAFLILSLWCLLGLVFYLRTVARIETVSSALASGMGMFALLLYAALMWLGKQIFSAESVLSVKDILVRNGIVALLIIFIGLGIVMYNQQLVHRKLKELRSTKEDRML